MSDQKDGVVRPALVPKKVLLVAAVLLVALCAMWAAQTQAFKLATTHQSEHFTELYFADPANLPAAVASGQVVPVVFALKNHEAQDVTYAYRITFFADGVSTPLAEGQQVVRDAQSQSLTQNITIPSGTSRGAVVVELINKRQSSQYCVERSAQ